MDNVIHPNAIINHQPFSYDMNLTLKMASFDTRIGERVHIGPFTVVCRGRQRNTIIGNDVKISSHCYIGSGAIIGKRTIIAQHVMIAGRVEIGENCEIWSGVNIRQGLKIGNNVVLGMGSVVTKDIDDDVVAWGNPAIDRRCEIFHKRHPVTPGKTYEKLYGTTETFIRCPVCRKSNYDL